MRKIFLFAAITSVSVALFTGCGSGSSDSNDTSSPPPSQGHTSTSSDFAPASIGGRTITGHIGGTNTVFQFITSGGTSGTYQYSENGNHLQNGTYTWTKTSDDTGALTIQPDGHVIELNYSAPRQGNYVFHVSNYTETGTFTTN